MTGETSNLAHDISNQTPFSKLERQTLLIYHSSNHHFEHYGCKSRFLQSVYWAQIVLAMQGNLVYLIKPKAINGNTCTLCEEFATQVVEYLNTNKTHLEIIGILQTSCSVLGYFKEKCVAMLDHYAPVFFLKLSSIQPIEVCQRVNLCEHSSRRSLPIIEDRCGFCHQAVAEIIVKLKDPDNQLEIIELLLKGCNALENYAKKCKRLIFEYGPAILVNSEKFLERIDICTTLHACPSSISSSIQATTTVEASLISDS